MRAPTNPEPIRVLYVDDADSAAQTATHLEREDARFVVETAASADEGMTRLAETAVDCVVSGYDMPGRDGIDFLEAVRADHPDLPFVLFADRGSEEVASDAISAGVTDYLRKEPGTDRYALLADRVANAVERDRSRRALEAGRERMSQFVEQSPLGVIEYDEEFTIAGINPAGEEILGYDEAELVGQAWEKLVSEESYDDVDRVADELARGTGGWHSVNENVRADGEVIVCEWHNHVVTDDDGEAVAVFAQFQDVTDRVERERELRRYEAYIEGSSDIITALDETGVVQYQSPSVTRILGYDPGELVGENGFAYVHADDRDEVTEAFDRLVRRPDEVVTTECRFQTADGGWRHLEIRGRNLLDDPNVGAIITNNRDVTDRTARERRLAALNETSRELMGADTREAVVETGVEAAREVLGLDANAIHLVDDQGVLAPVAVTDRVTDLVGEPPALSPGDSIAWQVYETGEARAVDDVRTESNVYREDTTVRGELYVPIGDHGVLIAGSTAREAFDRQDLVSGEILAGNIAAALDQVEQTAQLRARERELTRQNTRLEEFASVVSHDLRNPLNVARGRVDLVREKYESENLAHATAALERCQALIDDLLVLSRGGDEIGDVETVDLGSFACRCWETTATADATLDVEVARSVRADRSRLRQLLENLFRNAVEHGSTGDQNARRSGDAVEHGSEGVRVTLGALPDGFYVADDGPGIDPAARDEVFDTGYSTNPDGTGFGLDIVAQVAEAHGWTVEVAESSAGGARFEVRGVEFPDS